MTRGGALIRIALHRQGLEVNGRYDGSEGMWPDRSMKKKKGTVAEMGSETERSNKTGKVRIEFLPILRSAMRCGPRERNCSVDLGQGPAH